MNFNPKFIDEVAREIWLAEAKRGGGPISKLRQPSDWLNESEETHDRYRPLAEAAVRFILAPLYGEGEIK